MYYRFVSYYSPVSHKHCLSCACLISYKADVAMDTMSEQLDKEEAGLTTDRGLEGCVPGVQAFELFITATFRKKYDKVCCSL